MRKLAVLVVAMAVLAAALPINAGRADHGPLHEQVICLDPGHGGTESGAVYTKKGRNGFTLREKDINLDEALRLRDRLAQAGATVYMTREDDLEGDPDHYLSPQERAQICNSYSPDIAVSIHTNSTYSSRWDGSMTLVYDGTDMPLANVVHPIMYSGLKAGWDGRFTDYDINQDEWTFPKHSDAPAVILEPVFLSNHDEAAALRDTIAQNPDGRRAQIVQVVYDGIVAYFSQN